MGSRTRPLAASGGVVLFAATLLAPPVMATPRDVGSACADVPDAEFNDVTLTNVHGSMIDCVKARGITTGRTRRTYDPAGELRRDELASFLVRTLTAGGHPLAAPTSDHFDDDDGSVHEDAINRLAEAGIVPITSPSFGPGAVVTRAEMSLRTDAMLDAAGVLPSFGFVPDFYVDDDSSAAETAINRLTDAGIVTGQGDGLFGPELTLRRDQMATFLARSIDLLLDGAGSHDHCQVSPNVDSRFDRSWYTQQCEVMGLAIVGSTAVSADALRAAGTVVVGMLATRPDLARHLASAELYVAIAAESEGITELPEYRYLKDDPNIDWDDRARGFGGADLASAAEENLLCLDGDRYLGESIALHEFAHSLALAALYDVEPQYEERLRHAYESAMGAGLWTNTYAATDEYEYWAEGVQIYFGANLTASPADGIHGPIGTRGQLAKHDPALYELIDDVFRVSAWNYTCP